MKRSVLLLVLFGLSCTRNLTTPTSNEDGTRGRTPPSNRTAVTVQGTVVSFEGGGTGEMTYPPGFILTHLIWVSPPASFVSFMYITDGIDSSDINRRFTVVGVLDTTTAQGPVPGYTYFWLTIKPDSLLPMISQTIIPLDETPTLIDSTLFYARFFTEWGVSLDTARADSLANWFAGTAYRVSEMWFPAEHSRCLSPFGDNIVTVKLAAPDGGVKSLGFLPTGLAFGPCWLHYRYYRISH